MNAMKPRYTFKDGKLVMAQDIAPATKFALPAHLQGKAKVTEWGEVDAHQRILPRIKLLQATSPECADYPGQARPGEFWHTTLTESLGNDILAVPIMRHESYTLWAPRGDERGVLARARDAVHWDPPEGEFQVRFPMNPRTYVWKLARTVRESGLADFGSSRSDDPGSPPAATETLEVLWFLPDWNSLALTLNARSGLKAARQLFSMVDSKPASPFNQRYRICSVRNQGPGGETYFGYRYRGDGWCDEKLSAVTEAIYQQWKGVAFSTADEGDDDGAAPVSRREAVPERGARPVEPSESGSVVDDDIPF